MRSKGSPGLHPTPHSNAYPSTLIPTLMPIPIMVKEGTVQSLKPHLHQKSTCWKLLGTMRSRFPFSFLGSTSMAKGSGLLELLRSRTRKESREAIRIKAH